MKKKRKKFGRKLLSFFLALAMVIGLMPEMSLTAYAAGTLTIMVMEGLENMDEPGWAEQFYDGDVSIAEGTYVRFDMATMHTDVMNIYMNDEVVYTKPSGASYQPDVYHFTAGPNCKILGGYSQNMFDWYDNRNVYITQDASIAVTGVTLDPSTAQSINVGGSVAFTATVVPDNASDKTVKWSVGGTDTGAVTLYSDEACETPVELDTATETLTVYAAKGVSAGTATVTVTSNADDTKSASCEVTVNTYAGNPYASLVNATTSVEFNEMDWYIIADDSTAVDAGTVTLLAKECIGSGSDQLKRPYANSDIKASFDDMTETGGSFSDVADAIISVDLTDVNVSGAKLYLPNATELSNVPSDLLKCSQASGAQGNFWWLRSTAANNCWHAVDGAGGTIETSVSANHTWGVRPALKLDLSKVTFDSESNTFSLNSTAKTDQTAPAGLIATKASSNTSTDGKISGVNDDMEYQIDGATTWTAVGAGKTEITGLTAGTYKVRYVETADKNASPETTVTIGVKEDQTAPTGLTATKASSSTAADGKISGVNDDMEYQIDGATTWTAVGAGKTEITGLIAGTYKVRYVETADKNASPETTVTIGVKEDQTAPTGLTATKASSNTSTDGKISGVNDDMEYQIDGATTWTAVGAGKTEITGLTAGTYKVRYVETADKNASPETTVTIGVKEDQTAPTGLTATKASSSTAADGKISGVNDDMEYQIDGATTWTAVGAGKTEITGLIAGTYKVRYVGTADKNASPETTVTIGVKEDQTAPTGLTATKASSSTATDGKISGVNDDMEYQKNDSSTWTAVGAGKTEITGLTAGTYKVRYVGTADKNASPETTVTIGVKEDQTAPTGLTATKASSSTATDGKISGVNDDMEYQKNDTSTWTAVGAGKTEITGLTAGTYKVRYVGTADKNASPETTVTIGVKEDQTAPTGLTATKASSSTAIDGKISGVNDDMEYQKNDTSTWTAVGAGKTEITGLIAGTYKVRYVGTADKNASPETTVTIGVKEDQTAPTGLTATKASSSTATDGKISGVNDDMEYQIDGASTWTAVGAGKTEITGLTAGTYKVRYVGIADKNASPAVTVEVGVKVAPIVTAPIAKTLTYDGSVQALVNAGITTGGEMQYALGTATEATEAYTASIPTGTNAGIYYVWYKVVGDANHNNTEAQCVTAIIRAAISKTVTFKVVNGSWNDGTTADKTVTLTGYEGNTLKLTSAQIPAVGSKAADTFKAGSWDVTPSTNTAISQNTTYTYTYAKKDTISAKVTFKVANGSWNDGTTTDKTVTLTGYEGDTLKLTSAQIPAVGSKAADTFKAGSWDVTPSTNTAITANTTYTYTYAKKDTISAKVTFKVANGSWNDGTTTDKTVTLTGYEGDTLKLTSAQIPAVGSKAADTFKAGSWDVTPSTNTAITENTTYTYTYARKDTISAKVTFKVANGSWNDGKTKDVTVTLSGYEGDTLKLTADQIPAVGKKAADTFKAGSWDVTPSTNTAITGNTTYTYTYAKKDTISAKVTFKVVNGSWNDGKTKDVTVTLSGYEGDTLKLTADQIPAVGKKAADTFKAGKWDVTPNAKTTITGNTTYTYTYAKKDTISAKVTFKVVNGSWNDGKTKDVTVTLSGYEGDTLKLTADQIPAVGKKAADTFKAGSWDVTPNAKTAITGNTTYTYTYAKKDTISAKVTFKVVNGSWNDGKTKDVTVTLSGYEGDTLKLTADQIPAVGKKATDTFKAGSWDVTPNAKTAITGNTTYTYTYAKKDTISAKVTFKVVNGSWNDGKTKDVTVTLSGYEGDTLKLTADQIPAVGKKAADTFKAGKWDVTPNAKTAITGNTTYTYTYAKKDTISAKVTFKVVNGSWNDGKTKDVTVTLSGYEGDTLKLTADQIPAVGKKAAEGFKAGSWDVTPSTKTAIKANTTYTYTYVVEEVTPPDDKDGDVSVPEEKQKDNFAGGGLDNTGAEVKESVLTEEDKEQISAGKDVDVWLEVTDQTETVAEEEKAKVEEAGKELGSGYRVGAYMDLKLWKQVAGKQATKVEEVPNGKVKVSFTIPKGMRKDNTTYVIIGLHNGMTFVLKTTLDKTNWRISFETNRFSTYALAYQEQEPETKKSVTEIFTDLDPNAWYINAVQFVYDHALMVGKSATTFDPNAPITREQMVQVIYNYEGKPEAPNASPFNDVVEGSWYQNAVLWANANGITAGYGDGRFGVADAITREQMVRMLYNYAILKGYDISVTPGTSDGYADSATISGWAKEAMDWAVEKGIISGKGTQGMDKSQICLDPAGKASRVECAQVLTNFKQKIEK